MSDRDCWIFTKRDCCRFVMSRAFVTCTRGLKVSVVFWLSSGFYTVTKALSTPLPCLMIIVLLKSAIHFFFVLTSGRPLPVTTFYLFEATLQPLSSPDRDSGIFCTAATALFIAPSCNIHSYIPHFSWSLCLWFTYWVTEYLVFCFLPRRTPPYLVGLSIPHFFSVPSPWIKFSMVCRAALLQINQSNPGWHPIIKQVFM